MILETFSRSKFWILANTILVASFASMVMVMMMMRTPKQEHTLKSKESRKEMRGIRSGNVDFIEKGKIIMEMGMNGFVILV